MLINPYFTDDARHLSLLASLNRFCACARIAPDMRQLFIHES